MIPCLLFSIESATSIDLYDVYRYIGFRVMGSLYLRCHRLSFVQLCRPPPPALPGFRLSGIAGGVSHPGTPIMYTVNHLLNPKP